MEHFAPITTISEAIQLAVAPVFLLTGIGAILSVLTTRLGRVVDLHADLLSADVEIARLRLNRHHADIGASGCGDRLQTLADAHVVEPVRAGFIQGDLDEIRLRC